MRWILLLIVIPVFIFAQWFPLVRCQNDWHVGPGQYDTTDNWGNRFWFSSSINYAAAPLVLLSDLSDIDYTRWYKHWVGTLADAMYWQAFPADFNGDGLVDITAATGTYTYVFFANSPFDWTYTRVTVYSGSGGTSTNKIGVYPIDIDGDGDIDIVTGSGGLKILYNDGNGNFSVVANIDGLALYLYVDDFDGDGIVDIMTLDGMVVTIYWGTPGNPPVYNSSNTTDVASGNFWRAWAGDLDGNGLVDIAINSLHYTVWIYCQEPARNFTQAYSWSGGGLFGGSDGLWIADFENDGDLDVITAMDNFYVHQHDGSGSFSTHRLFSGDSYGDGAIMHDMDGDGLRDIIGVCSRFGFWRRTGPGYTDFDLYDIDALQSDAHWVFPYNMDRSNCSGDADIDAIVITGQNLFIYENDMYGFMESGSLYSAILGIPLHSHTAVACSVYWEGCQPAGYTVEVAGRIGESISHCENAEWGDVSNNPYHDVPQGWSAGITATATDTAWVQYRISMMRTGGNPKHSPQVDSVWAKIFKAREDTFLIDSVFIGGIYIEGCSLVHARVCVLDENSEYITGLDISDFSFVANGVPIVPPNLELVGRYSPEAAKVDVVLLFDFSTSMDDEVYSFFNHISEFVDAIDEADYRVAAMVFNGCPEELGSQPGKRFVVKTDFSGDTCTYDSQASDWWASNQTEFNCLFNAIVNDLYTTWLPLERGSGGEDQYGAIVVANEEFDFRPDARKVFVLFTDERPVVNSPSCLPCYDETPEGLDSIIAFCLQENIIVLPVTPHTGDFSYMWLEDPDRAWYDGYYELGPATDGEWFCLYSDNWSELVASIGEKIVWGLSPRDSTCYLFAWRETQFCIDNVHLYVTAADPMTSVYATGDAVYDALCHPELELTTPGGITSCPERGFFYAHVNPEDGALLPSTLMLIVNDDTLTAQSPGVLVSDSGISYSPPQPWEHGDVVIFDIAHIENESGCAVSTEPRVFMVELMPPYVTNFIPANGDTVLSPVGFGAMVDDDDAGVWYDQTASMAMWEGICPDPQTYMTWNVNDAGFLDTVYDATSALGNFDTGDRITVCVHAIDHIENYGYSCCPNKLDICWTFYIFPEAVEETKVPAELTLSVAPSPFNSSISIDYSIPSASHVSLEICDIMGHGVVTIVNEHQNAGTYTVNWTAAENAPSGLYFVKMKVGDRIMTERALLIR